LGADPANGFYLPPPPTSAWRAVASLESADLLAGCTGGTVGGPDDLRPPTRPSRTDGAMVCVLASLLAAASLSRGRWLPLLRWLAGIAGEENVHGPAIDAPAAAVEYGEQHSPAKPSRRGEPYGRVPLGPGAKLEAMRRQSLLRFAVGVPGIPELDVRLPPKAVALELVIDLGAGMRVGGGEKVRLAAVAAEVVAELFWLRGAAVRVWGTGLTDGPYSHGPVASSSGDAVSGLLAAWAVRRPGGGAALDLIEPAHGACIVWFSDFAEAEPPDLLSWAGATVDEGGSFAAVHVSCRDELERVGLSFASGPALAAFDRVGVAPDDLRAALARRVARLRRAFEAGGAGFAALEAGLDAAGLVERLHEGGVLGMAR
jgi:hypothetical protein